MTEPIASAAADLFQAAASSPKSFWKEIFFVNGQRQKEKKPWLFRSAIDWARGQTSFTDPAHLVEFIDAEWEEARNHNKPGIKKGGA